MNRTLASLAATVAFGGGVLLATIPGNGEKETFTLETATELLVFVGIEADYEALGGVEQVGLKLRDELKLEPVGTSLRSLSDGHRRVWGLRTADPDAAMKELKRNAKKKGLTVERLEASAIAAGRDPITGSVARAVESTDQRIWATWVGLRGQDLWIFHEPKLTAKALAKTLDANKMSFSWQHAVFELTSAADVPPDFAVLEKAAAEKLDLLLATRGENLLSLDVYLRGLDGMAVLKHGDAVRLCPDIRSRLIEPAAPGSTGWKLTFLAEGYPFL